MKIYTVVYRYAGVAQNLRYTVKAHSIFDAQDIFLEDLATPTLVTFVRVYPGQV